ncbi:Putative ribonuclease H protein At1g65750, partial [Linum grandiflorum]
ILHKQGWKLLQEPNALITKVLKAKYFPKGDFLTARVGYRPSFVWRSIFAAQDVVREGWRWRVEDGSKINVWTEPWLRDEANCYVETSPSMQLKDLTVNDLVIPSLRTWNYTLINNVFNVRDVQVISAMVPPDDTGHNRRIWRFEKQGKYSVRSAYHVAIDKRSIIPTLTVVGGWKTLWNAKLPPKMKQLLWRLAHGVVPTRSQLAHRGVEILDICGSCSQPGESLEHLLFECPVALDCWKQAGLWQWMVDTRTQTQDIRAWIFHILQTGAEFNIQRAAMVVWAVWRERNERIWNFVASTSNTIIWRAAMDLEDWVEAHKRQSGQGKRTALEFQKWHAPKPGMFKCNVDIATFPDLAAHGVGLVMRNMTGQVLHFAMSQIQGCREAREEEAAALVDAMEWVRGMGYDHVMFETDSQVTTSAILKDEPDYTEFGRSIKKCQHILRSTPLFKVRWIRRSGNEVAHELARRSRFFVSPVSGTTPPE